MNLMRLDSPRVPSWIVALSLVFAVGPALASWAPNGNQINPTVVPDGGAPVPLSLAPDGRGGVFLASGYDLQARLTHILDTGALAPGWSGDNGFYYFDGGYWPVVPDAVPD